MIPLIEHLEKEVRRYVIATFDDPTNYVVCNGGGNYSFIDNIQHASKFASEFAANEVYKSLYKRYNVDLVVLPLSIKYILLEE